MRKFFFFLFFILLSYNFSGKPADSTIRVSSNPNSPKHRKLKKYFPFVVRIVWNFCSCFFMFRGSTLKNIATTQKKRMNDEICSTDIRWFVLIHTSFLRFTLLTLTSLTYNEMRMNVTLLYSMLPFLSLFPL